MEASDTAALPDAFVGMLGELAQQRFAELLEEFTDMAAELDELSPYLPSNHGNIASRLSTQLCASLAASRWGNASSIAEPQVTVTAAIEPPRQAATVTAPRVALHQRQDSAASDDSFAEALMQRLSSCSSNSKKSAAASPKLARGPFADRELMADVGAVFTLLSPKASCNSSRMASHNSSFRLPTGVSPLDAARKSGTARGASSKVPLSPPPRQSLKDAD